MSTPLFPQRAAQRSSWNSRRPVAIFDRENQLIYVKDKRAEIAETCLCGDARYGFRYNLSSCRRLGGQQWITKKRVSSSSWRSQHRQGSRITAIALPMFEPRRK